MFWRKNNPMVQSEDNLWKYIFHNCCSTFLNFSLFTTLTSHVFSEATSNNRKKLRHFFAFQGGPQVVEHGEKWSWNWCRQGLKTFESTSIFTHHVNRFCLLENWKNTVVHSSLETYCYSTYQSTGSLTGYECALDTSASENKTRVKNYVVINP